MTDPRSESNPADKGQAVPAEEVEQLTRMLTDLADDPDAPASTVTARSVLEAARAGVADGTVQQDRVGAVLPAAAAAAAAPASVGDLHLLAVRAEAARTKAARRRTTLFSLAAAAAVAAVAAVVIPLAVSSNSTTTSANSAKDAAPAAAAESATAQSAPGASVESRAAAGDAAAGAAPAPQSDGEVAAAPELGTNPEQERPPPGDLAVTSVVPTAAPDTPQPTATAGQSCWPALPASAAAALIATLPAGAFQEPVALTAACGPDPVAGAALTGTAPGTALEVRVSKAESGRCARGNSEAGVRCVPAGDGVYVATAGGGSATAYVYGNGNEVTVGTESDNGLAPATTGLTDEQTIAAAQAVLGALG